MKNSKICKPSIFYVLNKPKILLYNYNLHDSIKDNKNEENKSERTNSYLKASKKEQVNLDNSFFSYQTFVGFRINSRLFSVEIGSFHVLYYSIIKSTFMNEEAISYFNPSKFYEASNLKVGLSRKDYFVKFILLPLWSPNTSKYIFS